MPGFVVTKNAVPVCAINSDGLELLDVRVSGDIWGPDVAHLDVSGCSFGEGKSLRHFWWEFLHPLVSGDTIEVQFVDAVQTSRPGDESPPLPPRSTDQFVPTPPPEEEVAGLEARPELFPNLEFLATLSSGRNVSGRLSNGRHFVSMNASWASHRADRARLSFRSVSLREAIARVDGAEYLSEYVSLGETITLRVQA